MIHARHTRAQPTTLSGNKRDGCCPTYLHRACARLREPPRERSVGRAVDIIAYRVFKHELRLRARMIRSLEGSPYKFWRSVSKETFHKSGKKKLSLGSNHTQLAPMETTGPFGAIWRRLATKNHFSELSTAEGPLVPSPKKRKKGNFIKRHVTPSRREFGTHIGSHTTYVGSPSIGAKPVGGGDRNRNENHPKNWIQE